MDEKDFELAALAEQLHRDYEIDRIRKRATLLSLPADFDGDCPQCGAEIQPARVAAGYAICIDCAREEELRRRLRTS